MRGESARSRSSWLLALSPLVAAVALMAAFAAARWPLWEQAFYSDQSPAAWLSSAQLVAASVLALRLGAVRDLPRASAVLLASALLWLALDEQFLLHEQWKFGCERGWSGCRFAAVREAPMLAVGVLGSSAVALLWRMVRDGRFRVLIGAALAVGLLAIVVDLGASPAQLIPFEEALEVLAEALFIGALLTIPPRTGT